MLSLRCTRIWTFSTHLCAWHWVQCNHLKQHSRCSSPQQPQLPEKWYQHGSLSTITLLISLRVPAPVPFHNHPINHLKGTCPSAVFHLLVYVALGRAQPSGAAQQVLLPAPAQHPPPHGCGPWHQPATAGAAAGLRRVSGTAAPGLQSHHQQPYGTDKCSTGTRSGVGTWGAPAHTNCTNSHVAD